MPEEVVQIIDSLHREGFEGYAVGGCVRDMVLGVEPKDWDIATDAKPWEVKEIFAETIDTGIKHGTVTVVINGKKFEVTTYRSDGRYSDNRHPDNVEFTPSLEEDLCRRDFTMNAIAYNHIRGFFDPLNGKRDIKRKTIRAVGIPDIRFREDALRMLRAVRFSAEKDFSIDKGTADSIAKNSSLIKNVSWERIRDELNRLLVSPNPLKFILLRDTGLLQHIMPEFEILFHVEQNNPHHVYNVGIHTLYAMANIENDLVLRWTMLLHDIGKPSTKTTDGYGVDHFYGHPEKSEEIARIILSRLKFDNKTLKEILHLIRHHDRNIGTNENSVRKAVAVIGEHLFEKYLKIREADISAQSPDFYESSMAKLKKVTQIYNEIKDESCFSLKGLKVNGDDLIAAGFRQGKEIGVVLNRLMEIVLENPSLNNRETLLEIARELI